MERAAAALESAGRPAAERQRRASPKRGRRSISRRSASRCRPAFRASSGRSTCSTRGSTCRRRSSTSQAINDAARGNAQPRRRQLLVQERARSRRARVGQHVSAGARGDCARRIGAAQVQTARRSTAGRRSRSRAASSPASTCCAPKSSSHRAPARDRAQERIRESQAAAGAHDRLAASARRSR